MRDRILITGASGMVGRRLAERLLEDGHPVRLLSRDPDRLPGRFDDRARIPGPGQGADAWGPLLEGVTHVVHCAGFADAAAARDEEELLAVNASWPGEIAAAVAGNIPGRFVHLSSIRAVAGPARCGTIDDATTPEPTDAYGKSKLGGEDAVRRAFAGAGGFSILRPAPIYGVPLKGNLARLLQLAQLPMPLPLGGLRRRRSLLAIESCVEAVMHVMSTPSTDRGTYVAADAQPMSIAAIIAAFRRGMGRSPALFPVPDGLLSTMCRAMAQTNSWLQVTQELIVDSRGLARSGWHPATNTEEALVRIASETDATRSAAEGDDAERRAPRRR